MARIVLAAVLICLLIALVHSAPTERPIPRVVSERFQQAENLEYSFAQKFENGESLEEDGKLKNVAGHDVIVTKGSYTVVEPDGSIVVVNYTADEKGFHPEIVSTPPPNRR